MKVINLSLVVLVLTILFASSSRASLIFSGVTFEAGAAAFADEVVSYTAGVNAGAGWNDPSVALGTPDWVGGSGTAVSLGIGGVLIVKFTDNSLTTSGNSDLDLWIFEVGTAVELFNVAISADGTSWIDLGDVIGQPTGIDIDAAAGVVVGTQYSYVRLTDVAPNQSGSPFGEADIDAIGAISSAPPVIETSSVPEPASLYALFFGLALMVARRKGITR